jgi:hypothetical protein
MVQKEDFKELVILGKYYKSIGNMEKMLATTASLEAIIEKNVKAREEALIENNVKAREDDIQVGAKTKTNTTVVPEVIVLPNE